MGLDSQGHCHLLPVAFIKLFNISAFQCPHWYHGGVHRLNP